MAAKGASEKEVNRAFGADNRNRLIDEYFSGQSADPIKFSNAWMHIYRLLLWSDPTTGLAHCYESDKCQPGKPWYARSLAFHDWLSSTLSVPPNLLAQHIDWLFIRACADLAQEVLKKASALSASAEKQLSPYAGKLFPSAGDDAEMSHLIKTAIAKHLNTEPTAEEFRTLTQRIRQYLALQNKRKNLVGEGFEDVLTHVVQRTATDTSVKVFTRALLYQLPGFNRAKTGQKENKVDLAIVRPKRRMLITAKWSLRADREKQFAAELAEYEAANSEPSNFEYVFVTNEFDPARLMRACDQLSGKSLMFDQVVHINPQAVKAAYGPAPKTPRKSDNSKLRVIDHIESGRLISLEQWLKNINA